MTGSEQLKFLILNKIAKYKLVVFQPTGCWIKRNYNIKNNDRYSVVTFKDSQINVHIGLHVLSAFLFCNLNPETQLSLHKCDIKGCCNPNHLYAGDNKQNRKDIVSRRRHYLVLGQLIESYHYQTIAQLKAKKEKKVIVESPDKMFLEFLPSDSFESKGE